MRPRFILLASFAACWMAGTLVAQTDFRARYQRPASVPAPADNVPNPARVELGKMLFFDPRLSGNGAMSCASCHNPSYSWTDPLPLGRGDNHQVLGRRTPTVLNAAFNPLQMWDGRFATLEAQAVGPLMSPQEMNVQPAEVEARLNALPRYRAMAQAAYGSETITLDLVAKAISSFERTIVSAEAPFDRFVKGDEQAISAEARRGFELFNTKARCASCHAGWNFTDGSFHDIGLVTADTGRGKILGFDSMDHTFKTPTLRNVAERAPYGHNGSESTLRGMIELYDRGGRVQRPTLSQDIKPLGLTETEKADLVAFLRTLTSPGPVVVPPELPGNEPGAQPAPARPHATVAASQ